MIVEAVTPPAGARRWPTAGTRLVVQEIYCSLNKEPNYRVERDEGPPVIVDESAERKQGDPVLLEASRAKIVDSSIPAHWVINYNQDRQYLDVGPEAWQQRGFWERYDDFDEEARKAYADNRSE